MNRTDETNVERQTLRSHWGLAVSLGILLMLLGVAALSMSVLATVLSMIVFGWLLLIGGIAQGVHAFSHRKANHHFLPDLLFGTLYVVVGIIVIANPVAAQFAVTLLLIAFFLVAGIFRIVAAASISLMRNRWSVLASGIIALCLGILLWMGWPMTALWVIGFFIGIELLVNGWSLVMLGVVARRLPGAIPHTP